MPLIDLDALKALIPVALVFELVGYEPTRRRGDEARGPCPLNQCRDRYQRCFRVNLITGLYICYRCDARGNALQLYAALTRQPLYEACLELCNRLSLTPPLSPRAGA